MDGRLLAPEQRAFIADWLGFSTDLLTGYERKIQEQAWLFGGEGVQPLLNELGNVMRHLGIPVLKVELRRDRIEFDMAEPMGYG